MNLPERETLTVEFKSDRKCLPDDDLIETVVGMANAEGGEIYLGVEDDGTPTGLHTRHAATETLAAMIGNRTLPAVAARVEKGRADNGAEVARISVPMLHEIVMTSGGKLLRRRLGSDGLPCTVPMHPYEMASRLSRFGKFDFSAQPCPNATPADLDPAERIRLRQAIETHRGDRALLELADDELDGALGLVARVEGERLPTHTGMLLIGRQDRLRQLVPTHEVMFQELRGADVRVNDGLRLPLIRLFEHLTLLFDARYAEDEVMVGMYRVPLPNYDRTAFREGLVNALAHRDYTVNNAIYIRLSEEGLSIASPGGFIEGVSQENILRAEPHSRNRTLADALKRIGLAERTGRGVDNVFRAVVRAGRPEPTYAGSTETAVQLRFPFRAADVEFVKMLVGLRNRLEGEPTLPMLLALRFLRDQGDASLAELACHTQHPVEEALAALTAAGAVTVAKGRVRLAGQPGDAEEKAVDAAQMRERVLEYVATHGKITRRDVMTCCGLGEDQAYRLLTKMVKQGLLLRQGGAKDAFYTRTP